MSFPASYRGVLAVAEVDGQDAAEGVLLAPGRDVPAPVPGKQWGFVSGSSFAAAQVTGLVALLRELAPNVQTQQVREALAARAPATVAARPPSHGRRLCGDRGDRWRLRLFLRGCGRCNVARSAVTSGANRRCPDLLRAGRGRCPRAGVGQRQRRLQLSVSRRFAESKRSGGPGRARVRRSARLLRRRVRVDGQDRPADLERSAGDLLCRLRGHHILRRHVRSRRRLFRFHRDDELRVPRARRRRYLRTISARLHYSPNYYGRGSDSVYGEIDAAHRLYDHVQAVAHVGALWTNARDVYGNSVDPIFDGRVGLLFDFDRFNVQVSWVGISQAYAGSRLRACAAATGPWLRSRGCSERPM